MVDRQLALGDLGGSLPAPARVRLAASVPRANFETSRKGTVAVVAPAGDLDLSGAQPLEAEIDRLLADPRLEAVVLDLRGVAFLDSSGLRVVIVAQMRAGDVGRRFVLVRGPETVHRVFEITRMAERLEWVADPAEVGGEARRLERELAPTPEAAAQARHAVDGIPTGLSASRARDVRLLVSELVTNAVRHADLESGDMIRLVVQLADHSLRVEVHDPGGGFEPQPPAPDPTRPSGWGLYLVAQLSDRWGVDSDDATHVWFELDRPAAAT
jgi:anti-anti-sigma factor